MSKKNKVAEGVKTVGFMLGITIVFIAVLSIVHVATAQRVKEQESLALKRSVLKAAGIEVPEKDDRLQKVFDEKVKAVKGKVEYYEVTSTGGYVFIRDGAGLWGTITAAVGLQSDLKTMTGIDFIKQNETPGLGARISEAWFRDQFKGKTAPLTFVEEKGKATDSEFNAVTGATISTTAVRDIINKLVKEAPAITEAKQ